jgi:hypothetical protein
MLAIGHDARLRQARIAASAPKTTYGKHKNKLLPLTGSQFLRNDVFGTVNKTVSVKGILQRTDQESSADDSPLSDAEPTRKDHGKLQAVVRAKRPRAPTRCTSLVKPTTREAGNALGEHTDTEQEESFSDSHPARRDRSVAQHHRSRLSAPSAYKTGKLKSAGVARGRLPLNELVLVSGAGNDDVFGHPNRNPRTLLRDPISSSAQPLLDAVDSRSSETAPAKRKAKVPLSAIRKRLRTPSSGHKSLERLRRKYNAARLTPTGSQAKRIVGDGFERSELTPSHTSRHTIKHMRRQREPLLAGLKALSLVSGPLPDVVFVSESNPSQLKLTNRGPSDRDESLLGYEAPATATSNNGTSSRTSNRRVSFNHDVERVISAQLASVSAPRRQPSEPLGSEDEMDEDNDGDEGGDEEEEEEDDDEAADTYLDQDELPPEEHHVFVDEVREIETSHPDARPKPRSSAVPDCLRHEQTGQQSMAPGFNQFIADANRLRTSSFRRRTFSGRPLLNEVNEPIDDDLRVDDMLLGEEDGQDLTTTRGSVDYITTNHNRAPHDTAGDDPLMRFPSRDPQREHNAFDRTASIQPKSILKNSKPHVSSDTNRSESTAANTRRNSMVDLEESRYFSAAKTQLESTPAKHTIIRKKSNSRFHDPIEVPYSDEMVLETSPKKPEYTNGSQLHLLRRTNEALWTSSAAMVPQTDLASLTRTVSRENGTLSQSVRRRSSLRFQSPKKLV